MRKFKFRKPLVTSEYPPTNKYVLWVKPGINNTIEDILSWNGSWESVVNKKTETVTVTETVEVPAEITLATILTMDVSTIESEINATEDLLALQDIKTGFDYIANVLQARIDELENSEDPSENPSEDPVE